MQGDVKLSSWPCICTQYKLLLAGRWLCLTGSYVVVPEHTQAKTLFPWYSPLFVQHKANDNMLPSFYSLECKTFWHCQTIGQHCYLPISFLSNTVPMTLLYLPCRAFWNNHTIGQHWYLPDVLLIQAKENTASLTRSFTLLQYQTWNFVHFTRHSLYAPYCLMSYNFCINSKQ